jgi:hypothetical protein
VAARLGGRWSPPERVLAAAATLLVLDGFAPWLVVRWSTTRFGPPQVVTEHANWASAWAASTGWSAGILLALASAAGWLFWQRRHPHRRATTITVVIALAGLALTSGTWVVAASTRLLGSGPTYELRPMKPGDVGIGRITRDSLSSGTVGWGFFVGVALMLTIAACAVLAARQGRAVKPSADRP